MRLSVKIDLNRSADNSHWKRWLLDGGVELMLTVANIELPTVPWASYHGTREETLPQGSALMRANPVQRVNRTVDVKQGHDAVAHDTFDTCSGGAIVEISNIHPIWQRPVSPCDHETSAIIGLRRRTRKAAQFTTEKRGIP